MFSHGQLLAATDFAILIHAGVQISFTQQNDGDIDVPELLFDYGKIWEIYQRNLRGAEGKLAELEIFCNSGSPTRESSDLALLPDQRRARA